MAMRKGVVWLSFLYQTHAHAHRVSFCLLFLSQVFGVIEAEAHGMDGSVFALSLEQLKEHHEQPAGYAMRECMAALPSNTT